jgi:hypothetical protein
MNNKSHVLYHGYYMTRLPGTKEMSQTWKESRTIEQNFFNGRQPWCTQVDKNRLGTAKLTEALSTRLSQMIEETFSFSS